MPQLSKADNKILTQVFDPESGSDRVEILIDPSLPADRHISSTVLPSLRSREKEAINSIESYETSLSKDSRDKDSAFRSALAILDSIVEEYPSYASARNNRAQLRRWRSGDRNLLVSREAAPAISDLKEAISLASPAKTTDAVSASQGKLLAQAYTQLGAVYLTASKESFEVAVVGEIFDGWWKERLEEEASRSFYLGGLYGNEVAKALAVHTNPHAKLCGSIVKEAMRKEFEGVGA